jgi:hypothetical protein
MLAGMPRIEGSETLLSKDIRFDERLELHRYDLDF